MMPNGIFSSSLYDASEFEIPFSVLWVSSFGRVFFLLLTFNLCYYFMRFSRVCLLFAGMVQLQRGNICDFERLQIGIAHEIFLFKTLHIKQSMSIWMNFWCVQNAAPNAFFGVYVEYIVSMQSLCCIMSVLLLEKMMNVYWRTLSPCYISHSRKCCARVFHEIEPNAVKDIQHGLTWHGMEFILFGDFFFFSILFYFSLLLTALFCYRWKIQFIEIQYSLHKIMTTQWWRHFVNSELTEQEKKRKKNPLETINKQNYFEMMKIWIFHMTDMGSYLIHNHTYTTHAPAPSSILIQQKKNIHNLHEVW